MVTSVHTWLHLVTHRQYLVTPYNVLSHLVTESVFGGLALQGKFDPTSFTSKI